MKKLKRMEENLSGGENDGGTRGKASEKDVEDRKRIINLQLFINTY